MRVICINGDPTGYGFSHLVKPLPEYTPLEAMPGYSEDHYVIAGHERAIDGRPVQWHECRFVPCSDIDETEMVRESNLIKI